MTDSIDLPERISAALRERENDSLPIPIVLLLTEAMFEIVKQRMEIGAMYKELKTLRANQQYRSYLGH